MASSDQEEEHEASTHQSEDNNFEGSINNEEKEGHEEISASEEHKEREIEQQMEEEEEGGVAEGGRDEEMENKEHDNGEDPMEEDTKKEKTEEELQKEELTKEIFGDSDVEEDFNVPVPQQYNDSEDDDMGGSSKKLKRLKKREREEEASDEENQENEEVEKVEKKKKKKSKKRRREDKEPSSKRRKKRGSDDEDAVVEEPPQEEEDGEEAGRAGSDNNQDEDAADNRRLQNKMLSDLPDFDAALERIKKRRPKKPKDEELEPIIEEFISKMNQSAELDIQANTNKEPATHKIQYLPEVVKTLGRTYYFDKFLAAGGSSAIRRWLDRLPDGSLPNLNIREHLITILQKLPLTTEHLQESGVGKVVMGLWKAGGETTLNKKKCAQLIEKWSRPIFKLSSRYEDLESIESDLPARRAPKKTEGEESAFDLATKNSLRVTSSRIHAAIPEKVAMDFRKRPTASDLKVETPNVKNPHVLAATADKLIKKKLGKGKPHFGGKVQRAERMSIEGRGVK